MDWYGYLWKLVTIGSKFVYNLITYLRDLQATYLGVK